VITKKKGKRREEESTRGKTTIVKNLPLEPEERSGHTLSLLSGEIKKKGKGEGTQVTVK